MNELVINRPPDEVFDFFSDHENDKLWRTGVIEMRKLSGDGVGARYAQSVKGPGGRSIQAGIEVTEFERPRRLAFRTVEGPVRPTGSYSLEQTGEGTRVRFELSAELGGLKRFMKGPVEKTMRSEVARLESAKQVLESSRS
jgi:uncharacterized protein YndB with AHSA1/START domain